MPGLRKGRCQRSWRAARQQDRRMAFLTINYYGRKCQERISMKHYIIAKLNEGIDRNALIGPVTAIFEEALQIPGVHSVKVKPCCIDRPNRYDIMIEIGMDKEALAAYDASAPHRKWKEAYGGMLAAKTIFDSEE